MKDTSKPHSQNSTNRKSHDSPVAVKPPYSAKRKKTTIRIREDLWDQFKGDTAEKHLSTCHVLEALITAWLYSGSLVPGVNGHVNLTVNMQHIVERPRRRGGEKYVRKKPKKRANEFHDGLGRPKNHYDPHQGWYHDEDLDPGMIVVEQLREWDGENKGFTWSEAGQKWWKKKG